MILQDKSENEQSLLTEIEQKSVIMNKTDDHSSPVGDHSLNNETSPVSFLKF